MKRQPIPNQYGVYDRDDAECLTLPMPKAGWRGGPLAEICLLQTEAGWISNRDFQIMEGDCHGSFEPLTTHQTYPDRASALRDAVERTRRSMTDKTGRHAAMIWQWLDSLTPAQFTMDFL